LRRSSKNGIDLYIYKIRYEGYEELGQDCQGLKNINFDVKKKLIEDTFDTILVEERRKKTNETIVRRNGPS